MKKLILLSITTALIGCGSVEVPLFEKHLGEDNHSGDTATPVSPQVHVLSAQIADCNYKAYNARCTSVQPMGRMLSDHELYNHYCVNRYKICLNYRGGRP